MLQRDGTVTLTKVQHDTTTVLASTNCAMVFGEAHSFQLSVKAGELVGQIGDVRLTASDSTFSEGSVALIVDEGRVATNAVSVRPSQ